MTKKSPVCLFGVVAMIFIFSILSLITGIMEYKDTEKSIKSCTEKTTARVLGVDDRQDTGKFPHTKYRAQLEIQDRDYILVSDWSNKKFRSGTTIEIFYDPASPDCLYIPSNPPFSGFHARRSIIYGIVGMPLSILVLLYEIKQFKKEGLL